VLIIRTWLGRIEPSETPSGTERPISARTCDRIDLTGLLQLSSRFQGRTFGAPGLTAQAVNSEGRARAVEEEKAARVTRRRRLRFDRGLAVARRPASPRPSDVGPTDAAAGRARYPGDRPPAVPAVSRCRARQHHGQAVNVTPSTPVSERVSQARAPERRALSGSAPPASRAPEDRF